MVLKKGLSLLENSRSGYVDFKNSIEFMEQNERVREYMDAIISEEIPVRHIEDIHRAFEHNPMNDFKTLMKWEV